MAPVAPWEAVTAHVVPVEAAVMGSMEQGRVPGAGDHTLSYHNRIMTYVSIPLGTTKASCLYHQVFHQKETEHRTKNTTRFSTLRLTCHHVFIYQLLQPLTT